MKIFARTVLLLALIAGRAQAEAPGDATHSRSGDLTACVADHKLVQTQRGAGHYLASRDAAARCAQPSCPQLIRQDCAAWYVDLADSTPTIVLDVHDDRGRDLPDAKVTLDGQRLDLDGRAIALDPGMHELHVEAPRHLARVERILLRQGEHNRRVAIALPPALVASAPTPKQPPRAFSPAVITLAAVGLAGLGTFGALAITGKLRRDDLEDCKPGCASADVDTVNRRYLGANIAAAIGGTATIAATVLYVLDRRRVDVALSPLGVRLRGAF